MDLSTGIGDLNTDILAGDICSDHDSLLDEILDLSGLDMDDEETWYVFNFNWHQKLNWLLF